MAINLLNAQRLGLNNSTIQATANGGNLSTLGLSAPMGTKAVTPATKVPGPATTLPKAQTAPLAVQSATPAIPQTPAPAIPNAPTQYSGTQHPGDAGFSPIAPKAPAPTNTAEYDSNGNYIGTQMAGQTNQQTAPQGTSFGGLLGAAVNQQNSPYNQSAMGNINQTAAYGAGNIGIGQQAQQIADNYGKQIANVGTQGAGFEGGQLTTGTSPVASGNAAITAQTTAAEQQALATGEGAALQGIGYQLTGQNQAANASNAAAGQSLTGQGQVQGALQGAAGLAQPNQAAYGQTVFDPVTGQYTDGGGLPANVLQQYAQMAANGQYSAIPSSITGNPVLSAQLNQAAAAINPNYNPINSAAQGAAGASNIQTAGTAGTNIAAQGASNAIQSYNSLNAANSTFDNQASQVLGVLSQGQLNGSIPDVNRAINQLGGKLGSTQVQALSSSLTELGAAYTNLLSSNGGTPTAQDQQALAALSPNSSAAQIATSIAQLKAAAQIKLQSAQSLASQYGNALGSTGNTGSGGTVQTKAGAVNTSW